MLPQNIGNALPNLEELLFGCNMFGGHIPASLGNASKLTWIDFMDNSFAGAIGEWIGKLTNLEYIYLEGNSFSGPIPYSISNLSQLKVLELSSNNFSGTIGEGIG